mgnify:CR=1 FL=1
MTQEQSDNQNAAKEVRREAVIHSRTTPEDKSRYIRLSRQRGIKLTEWVNDALRKAAEEQEAQNGQNDT